MWSVTLPSSLLQSISNCSWLSLHVRTPLKGSLSPQLENMSPPKCQPPQSLYSYIIYNLLHSPSLSVCLFASQNPDRPSPHDRVTSHITPAQTDRQTDRWLGRHAGRWVDMLEVSVTVAASVCHICLFFFFKFFSFPVCLPLEVQNWHQSPMGTHTHTHSPPNRWPHPVWLVGKDTHTHTHTIQSVI